MDKNLGTLICGKERHEAIKADPEKIRAFTIPARPQILPDRVLKQCECVACGSTLVIREIKLAGSSDDSLGTDSDG